jgi:hypothetical protein
VIRIINKMSNFRIPVSLEPCSDCPVPMNVIINNLTKKDDTQPKYGIECRECGEKWTELVDE